MKKIIFPSCLALCVLFSSCAENNGNIRQTESMTVSLTLPETSKAETSAATAAPEKNFLGDYTVTTQEIPEAPPEEFRAETFSLYDIWEKKENEILEYFSYPIDDTRVCFIFYTGDEADRSVIFRVADADTGEACGEYSFVNENGRMLGSFYPKSECAGGELFKAVFYEYPKNDDGTEDYTGDFIYSVFTALEDGTGELKENADNSDMSRRSAGERRVSCETLDILDENGSVIVAGKYDNETELSFYHIRQNYVFPLGENRFVYHSTGFETWYGIGFYDYETGEATLLPDTKDLYPLGAVSGKILSAKGAWDGVTKDELFLTDPDTGETVPVEHGLPALTSEQYYEYAVPESGSYIAAVRKGGESPVTVFLSDPETFEVTEEYEIEDCPNDQSTFFRYASDSKLFLWSSTANELIVFKVMSYEL